MDKRLFEKIIKHFDFGTMEVLKEYIADRLVSVHNLMDVTSDADEWRKLQGEARALKTLEKIRDHAVAIKDQKNG